MNDQVRFKEGDIVYHRNNLTKPLEVEKIVTSYNKFEKDGQERTQKRIVGIRCGWWAHSQPNPFAEDGENAKEAPKDVWRTHTFHSLSLIPEEIVLQGPDAVDHFQATRNIKWSDKYKGK